MSRPVLPRRLASRRFAVDAGGMVPLSRRLLGRITDREGYQAVVTTSSASTQRTRASPAYLGVRRADRRLAGVEADQGIVDMHRCSVFSPVTVTNTYD